MYAANRAAAALLAVAAFLLFAPMAPAEAAPFGLIKDRQLECLALNVYFESRAEPRAGQLAVAYTTLNRVHDERFPDTICDVVLQGGETKRGRCQFSWWCDGRSDAVTETAAWEESVRIARYALQRRAADPTQGALYFHSTGVDPRWSRHMKLTAKIGRHLFYR